MKSRDWVRLATAVVIVLALDQLTKGWALGLAPGEAVQLGWLKLETHFNSGAFLGSFSGYSPVLRVVSVSTLGVSLVFWFLVFQWLIPGRLIPLRLALSLALAGILGNVIDRISRGMVVDFISLDGGGWRTPVLNVADLIQWVGYAMLVVSLFRFRKQLWPDRDARKSLWVNPSFQLGYCLRLVVLGLCFALVTGTLSYTYLRMVLGRFQPPTEPASVELLQSFALTFGLASLTFCGFLFAVGIVLSHRAAGPLYAFERFLEDLLSGKSKPLKLRAGDEFRHLEELAGSISEKVGKIRRKD